MATRTPRRSGLVRIPLAFGGRTVEYPVRVQIAETRYVLLFGGLTLQGEIDGRTIRLFDENLDGRFGVAGEDTLLVTSGRAPAEGAGADCERIPISRHAALGGLRYAIALEEAVRCAEKAAGLYPDPGIAERARTYRKELDAGSQDGR